VATWQDGPPLLHKPEAPPAPRLTIDRPPVSLVEQSLKLIFAPLLLLGLPVGLFLVAAHRITWQNFVDSLREELSFADT
jgi:hypothetical protein